MATLLRWFTAFNVLGMLVLALWLLAPGALSEMLFRGASVEIQLIPFDSGPPRGAVAVAQETRLEIPERFRTPDLSMRPWAYLPDGGVRFVD
jgi:hypothetical protein